MITPPKLSGKVWAGHHTLTGADDTALTALTRIRGGARNT
jgi:hypothetical protein